MLICLGESFEETLATAPAQGQAAISKAVTALKTAADDYPEDTQLNITCKACNSTFIQTIYYCILKTDTPIPSIQH